MIFGKQVSFLGAVLMIASASLIYPSDSAAIDLPNYGGQWKGKITVTRSYMRPVANPDIDKPTPPPESVTETVDSNCSVDFTVEQTDDRLEFLNPRVYTCGGVTVFTGPSVKFGLKVPGPGEDQSVRQIISPEGQQIAILWDFGLQDQLVAGTGSNQILVDIQSTLQDANAKVLRPNPVAWEEQKRKTIDGVDYLYSYAGMLQDQKRPSVDGKAATKKTKKAKTK